MRRKKPPFKINEEPNETAKVEKELIPFSELFKLDKALRKPLDQHDKARLFDNLFCVDVGYGVIKADLHKIEVGEFCTLYYLGEMPVAVRSDETEDTAFLSEEAYDMLYSILVASIRENRAESSFLCENAMIEKSHFVSRVKGINSAVVACFDGKPIKIKNKVVSLFDDEDGGSAEMVSITDADGISRTVAVEELEIRIAGLEN